MIKIEEIENILDIFKKAQKAINDRNFYELGELSDHTVNTASKTQDPDNITVAVIIYSLGKILGRPNYQKFPGWKKYYSNLIFSIENIIKQLQKNDITSARATLNEMRASIEHLSGDLKFYIQDVFRKASINKASKIYEHGISMETTAKLLGITLWELASYAGAKASTTEAVDERGISVKSRIKIAMEMFG